MSNEEIIAEQYTKAAQGIKEEWLLGEGTEWYDYVIYLPVPLRNTYLILVCNNQVFNGGFDQYFVNGYGQFAKETIEALFNIGAVKKAGLLNEALSRVNYQKYPDEVFREKLLKKELVTLFTDEIEDMLDKLDNEYYDSEDEDIETLLGNYLRREKKDPDPRNN